MLRSVGLVRATAPAVRVGPVRPIVTSAVSLAPGKQAAPKKKVSVRRGAPTGERRTGGRRKGGVDVRI